MELRPGSLNGSLTEALMLTEEITSAPSVIGTCQYICVVHSTVASKDKVFLRGSTTCVVVVSHVHVPRGTLSKIIVMDAF